MITSSSASPDVARAWCRWSNAAAASATSLGARWSRKPSGSVCRSAGGRPRTFGLDGMVSCGADSDAPSSARVLGLLGDAVNGDGDGERWSAAADDDGRGSGDGGDDSAAAAAAAAAAPASSAAARSIRGRRPPRLPSLFLRGPRAAFAAPSARFGLRASAACAACSAAEPSVGGALSVGFSGLFGGEEDAT